jgi:hypothetical protein
MSDALESPERALAEDIARRTDAGHRLAKRLILVDQATLSAAFLNVFL